MERISGLAYSVRYYVNDAKLCDTRFKTRPDEWYALCVAMDTLEDSCLALQYYEASGIGDEYGERYLKLYGLLQAVFLQQDSIRQLYRTFVGTHLESDSHSAWMRIRDLRNLTVGHPIEKRDKTGTKRCFISRVTIETDEFRLRVWNKDEGRYEFEDVDLKHLYESYKSEAIEHLEEVHRAQLNRWGPLEE
jgi:hypothetical protein